MKMRKVWLLTISFVLLVTLLIACAKKDDIQDSDNNVPVHEHTIVIDAAVKATCTSTGLTEGKHCSVCGEVIVAQVTIEKTSHTVVTEPAISATCTSTGLTEGSYCAECGKILAVRQMIGKTDHNVVVDNAIESTCYKPGLTEGAHCAECGTILVSQTVSPMKAHTYDDNYDETCNECGYKRDAECPHTKLLTIPEKSATCTTPGLTEGKECAKCGEILVSQLVIDALGHIEVIDDAVPATCLEIGFTEGKHCSRCDEIIVSQVTIAALGHVEVIDAAVSSTCTVNGLTEGKHCSRCNNILTSQIVIPAPGHKVVVEKAVDATCTSDGMTEGKYCSRCNEILVPRVIVPAPGHNEVIDEAVPATCTVAGLTEGKHCSVCNLTIVPQEVVTVEHDFENRVCKSCGVIEYSKSLAYMKKSASTCYISGIGNCNDTEIYIPEYIDGLKVVGIASNAFRFRDTLTSIVIPDSVKTIGDSAFQGCSRLTSIIISSSVNSIGNRVFYNCVALKSIVVAEENPVYHSAGNCLIETESKKLISGCNTSIIPTDGSVVSIEAYAFSACDSFTSIVIPNGVTSIGEYAFSNCSNVTDLLIPDSVTSIGSNPFYGCTNIESVTIPTIAISKIPNKTNLKNVVITSGTDIGYEAFLNSSNLVSISIPDGIISIGSNAFRGCSSLTDVVIPDSVESIGSYAFYGCTSLQSITVPFVGATKDGLTNTYLGYIFGATNCYNPSNIPASLRKVVLTDVTYIPKNAFTHFSNLTSIVLPEDITRIEGSAFSYCSNLTDLTIPDSVMSIGFDAFCGCVSLTSIIIPEGVTVIEGYMFAGCSSLANIVIPEGVTRIDACAFSECTSLMSIVIPTTLESIASEAFYECTNLKSVFITDLVDWLNISLTGSHSNPCAYGAQLYLNNQELVELVIPDGITQIGILAFSGCESITRVVIPDGVISIRSNAFENCCNLKDIVISDNIAFVDYNAFYQCNALESITVPASALWAIPTDNLKRAVITSGTSIDVPFYSSKLISVTIPDTITSITANAFNNCGSLERVYITDIDAWMNISFGNIYSNPCRCGAALYVNNEELDTLVIPDGVTSIGKYVFSGCSSIKELVIPDSVTSIGEGAFENCGNIESVIIPSFAISSITNKTNLKTVIITSGTDIADNAFWSSSKLTNVIIADSVTRIGAYAFNNCSNLAGITIPKNLTTIGSSAFYGCVNLESIVVEEGNLKYHSFGNCLIEIQSKALILGCRNSTIPSDGSVTSIRYDAFYGCVGLKSIIIPNSVVSISTSAFSHCADLESIVVEQGNPIYHSEGNCLIETATKTLFLGCKNSVIPTDGSVTIIGSCSFWGCTGLKTIIIPECITRLLGNPFAFCTGINFNEYNDAYYLGNETNKYFVLVNVNQDTQIASYSIHPDTKFILSSAFSYCCNITSIVIPDGVISIGGSAFYYCCNLTSVTIPDSVISIDGDAFSNCDNLKSIVIPNSIKSISYKMFRGCNSLTSIVIPNSITSVGQEAFYYCDSLDTVYYLGTYTEWNSIEIGLFNRALTSATRYYYSEKRPVDTTYQYWHYVDGVPTPW